VATQKPKAPPSVGERVTNFLGWAFVISIGIHFFVLPLVIRYNPSHAEQPETEKVSVSKKVKVVVPTPPPPTPTPPPPTPPPKSTPPPVHQTNPPPQPKLKVNVVHTTSKSNSGPSEAKYNVQKGSESGVPQGTVASAAPAKAAATAAAPPAPTPTPRPQCAVPNAEAKTVNAVTPDTPEMAKEQGVTGTVEVDVSLDAAGKVLSASVIKTPSVLLNSEALKAARQSTYSPQIADCKPIPGDYKFVVEFAGQ
jgi:periplasmic protein TonB